MEKSKNILLGLLLTLIGIGVFQQTASRIIVSEKMDNGRIHYGFEISEYHFRSGLWIKIWNSRGLNLIFYDTKLEIDQVVQKRWMANDKAVYLKLNIRVLHDSLWVRSTAQILYDYKRGELYVTALEPLWRTGEWQDFMISDEDWMSEEEFQDKLTQLEKQYAD